MIRFDAPVGQPFRNLAKRESFFVTQDFNRPRMIGDEFPLRLICRLRQEGIRRGNVGQGSGNGGRLVIITSWGGRELWSDLFGFWFPILVIAHGRTFAGGGRIVENGENCG